MSRYYSDLYTMQELSYLGETVLVSIWFRAGTFPKFAYKLPKMNVSHLF